MKDNWEECIKKFVRSYWDDVGYNNYYVKKSECFELNYQNNNDSSYFRVIAQKIAKHETI